jgi:hypothetical protein
VKIALARLFWLWIASPWCYVYSGHQEGGEYDDFLVPHNLNESALVWNI